jgi:hypothetical protein
MELRWTLVVPGIANTSDLGTGPLRVAANCGRIALRSVPGLVAVDASSSTGAESDAAMHHNQKSVRFYIDRDVDAPIVRQVPVQRPDPVDSARMTETKDEQERARAVRDRAAQAAASDSLAQISKRSRARQRVRELVRASVGRRVASSNVR